MQTSSGHLTYCTNIHAGESWHDHFMALQKNFPGIKQSVSPESVMGIGLRLSNEASIEIEKSDNLIIFQQWLAENDAYVFTMNGFPYGGFHHTIVKENVHTPDWTTDERVEYTKRLFNILGFLLPGEMEGGISTNPLGYRHHFPTAELFENAKKTGTENILKIILHLIELHRTTGKICHLDIEPEPDGIMETGLEFINWYENDLLKSGIPFLVSQLAISQEEADKLIRQHVQLCYDVCHFAIGFEPHKEIISLLLQKEIPIGKIQISAALKSLITTDTHENVKESFAQFDEPTYLHQVVAKMKEGSLVRYRDLSNALKDDNNNESLEWRAHFHVPVFIENFGLLTSTQDEIIEVLALQKENPFCNHLEVETYTWEVIPDSLRLPLKDSITRELQWVKEILHEK